MLRVGKPPKVVEKLGPFVFLLVHAHNVPNAKALGEGGGDVKMKLKIRVMMLIMLLR